MIHRQSLHDIYNMIKTLKLLIQFKCKGYTELHVHAAIKVCLNQITYIVSYINEFAHRCRGIYHKSKIK